MSSDLMSPFGILDSGWGTVVVVLLEGVEADIYNFVWGATKK